MKNKINIQQKPRKCNHLEEEIMTGSYFYSNGEIGDDIDYVTICAKCYKTIKKYHSTKKRKGENERDF